jgi:hypothetical protein
MSFSRRAVRASIISILRSRAFSFRARAALGFMDESLVLGTKLEFGPCCLFPYSGPGFDKSNRRKCTTSTVSRGQPTCTYNNLHVSGKPPNTKKYVQDGIVTVRRTVREIIQIRFELANGISTDFCRWSTHEIASRSRRSRLQTCSANSRYSS